jgi:hypothetical protein
VPPSRRIGEIRAKIEPEAAPEVGQNWDRSAGKKRGQETRARNAGKKRGQETRTRSPSHKRNPRRVRNALAGSPGRKWGPQPDRLLNLKPADEFGEEKCCF